MFSEITFQTKKLNVTIPMDDRQNTKVSTSNM